MRRSILVLTLITLIALPVLGHAARKERGPKVAPSTPRQFTSSMALSGAGGVQVTIVATAADEGRAKGSLGKALSQASSTASAAMAEIATANSEPRKTPIKISEELYEIIDGCRTLSALTGGAFDITGTTSASKFQFVKRDWRRLKLNKKKGTLTIKSDDVEIDPATFGLALRGFIADDIIMQLQGEGWKNVQVKIGNVTRNIGRNIHTPWTIRLDAPTAAEKGKFAFRAYDYSVGDVATAMISPRLFPEGIVDPRTRELVTDPAVINTIVFANDAATATAYAIAAYANSAHKAEYGMQFIESHPEVKGIVIAPDGTQLASKGLGINRPNYGAAPSTTTGKIETESKMQSTKSEIRNKSE